MKKKLLTIIFFLIPLFVTWYVAVAEDWNKPVVTDAYSTVLPAIDARLDSSAKMDYSSATNLPTGVIRWNSTSKKFETWNGSTWTDIYPELAAHLASTSNPHSVTAAQVGAASSATLSAHTSNTSNPHSTTPEQIGALKAGSNLADVASKPSSRSNLGVPSVTDLTNHTSNTSNPHGVTTTQIGALKASNNLSDITNAATARGNISAAQSGANGDITSLIGASDIRGSGNLTLSSAVFGTSVYIKPADSSSFQWEFKTGGQVKPPAGLQPDYTPWPSGYTVRRSLDPSVATAQQCADAINTLWADLIAQGELK